MAGEHQGDLFRNSNVAHASDPCMACAVKCDFRIYNALALLQSGEPFTHRITDIMMPPSRQLREQVDMASSFDLVHIIKESQLK